MFKEVLSNATLRQRISLSPNLFPERIWLYMIPILCPGIHSEALTLSFMRSLSLRLDCLVFPAHRLPPYSPKHILDWLTPHRQVWNQGMCFIGFSAGVVGALGAARHLWRCHRPIHSLIALDGWGVPLSEPFPTHRISHDGVTHRTSLLLGPRGGEHFYAVPPVDHLELWRSPHHVTGWRTIPGSSPQQTTAAAFLKLLLSRYCNSVR